MKRLILLSLIFISISINAQCLLDKDAGSSPADLVNLAADYNNPSPYPFGEMLGINDAGQFQVLEKTPNPIRFMTTKMRDFRSMDYDFNQYLQYGTPYADLIKPKDVNGFPQYLGTGSNDNYENFVGYQGITSISAATEILNKSALTWKEKIWQESDWWPAGSGLTIPQQIQQSYENYTVTFLQRYGNAGTNIVDFYQVGNELWDYPFEEDYHAMLQGAHNAFVAEYGSNSANWPVKFMPGSFQAHTINNICSSHLRDFSNCGSSGDNMFNQIGDYLNIGNCNVIQDMYAINIHAYPFDEGTQNYVYPEKPKNEFLGFIASVAFRDANPILQNKGIWLTETGYDSWDIDNGSGGAVGVGYLTQAAYNLRIFLMTGRYHLERVDFYMGFDQNRKDNYWHGNIYNSSGFWELGVHPVWNSGSPNPAHGAKPKPAFFTMCDFQDKFETKVFYQALAETSDVYAYILAEPDGSDAYLVFWNPTDTDDNNVFNSVSVNQPIVLPNNYAVNSTAATYFATTGDENNAPYTPTPGNSFTAVTGTSPGSTTIINATRMPAFIKLTQNAPCVGATISVSTNTISATITASNVDYINVLSANTVVATICSSTSTPCTNGNSNNVSVTPGMYTVEIGLSNGTTCQSTVTVSGCTDNDNDGVCASVDCDDNNASIPTTPGTSCDDGDPSTSGDVIQADGCTCLGSVPAPCDTTYTTCSGVSITVGSGSISIEVTGTNLNFAKVMLPDYSLVEWFCAAWQSTPCTNGLTAQATGLAGNYIVQVEYTDGTRCSIDNISVIVSDNDNDGVCTAEDCDDNDPTIPTIPGTACDDGNPLTSNDEIQADGCTCLGTSCETQYTDCAGAIIFAGDSSISVSVTAGDVDYVKVMLPDYTLVDWLCASWLTNCSNGFNASIPATAGTYVVQLKYSDGSTCNTHGVTVGGSGSCNPDLTVTTILVPANIQGISTISTVIRVSEVAGYNTEGSTITVRVPSDGRLLFNWDPSLTQIGFNMVDNTVWNYAGDNGIFHSFEFSNVLLAGDNLQFGFIGSYDPQNTDGQTTISATVVPFSGGETNASNNADSELLIYFD